MDEQTRAGELLRRLHQGDEDARRELAPLIYQQLRVLAHRQIGRSGRFDTLNTTALVNEAWVKLAASGAEFESRRHFLACAALAMRQILVDYARNRKAQKRGAGAPHLTLEEQQVAATQTAEELLELDAALAELEAIEPRLSQVVMLRYFAGLNVDQVAEVMACSSRTIVRDWRQARATLNAMMAA